MIILPFNEIKLVVTVYVTHADEDPYTFEFLVDLSKISLNSDLTNQFFEASYAEEGNNITLGSQIVYESQLDLKNNVNYQVNLDTSYQNMSTGSNASGKPEFGRTAFLVLKQFSATLPLFRKVS